MGQGYGKQALNLSVKAASPESPLRIVLANSVELTCQHFSIANKRILVDGVDRGAYEGLGSVAVHGDVKTAHVAMVKNAEFHSSVGRTSIVMSQAKIAGAVNGEIEATMTNMDISGDIQGDLDATMSSVKARDWKGKTDANLSHIDKRNQ